MKVYNNPAKNTWARILTRPAIETNELDSIVGDILSEVRKRGDGALLEYCLKFDKVELKNITVNKEEWEEGLSTVSEELKEALSQAKSNIEAFHVSQKTETKIVETMPGVQCWQKAVAIEKVGLYIPGGTAPLFSTILMLAVPAQIAGCKEIILCTPPRKDGTVNPVMLYAAKLAGVSKIYKVGGAQAIAAMAYGTETIEAVNKIFGPGNQYVTAAKQMVAKDTVAIDLPAGPSEVLVYADETASPAFVAADLLSQAEHGADSQVVLVAEDENFVNKVLEEITKQLEVLPRKEMASKALENSVAIVVPDKSIALELINEYAPEHLILALDLADEFAEKIINAGSVFIGHLTPESVGDYASGTNHTLPTNGYAKSYSGVNLDAFVKKITYQKITEKGLRNIGSTVELMAAEEQLEAHKNAVTIRLNQINKKP